MTASRTVRTTLAIVGSVLVAILVAAAWTGRPVVSYARSGSMEPTIGTLDAFLIEPWPPSLAIGDIIVFQSVSRGEPAVHRIVGGDARGWYTQGDANPNNDQNTGEPVVTRDRILGRVVVDRQGDPLLARGLGVPLVQLNVEYVKLAEKVGGEQKLKLGAIALAAALLVVGGARTQSIPAAPRALPPRRARSALRRFFPRGVLGRHLATFLALLAVASGALGALNADQPVDVQMIVVEDPAAADGRRAAPAGGQIERAVEVGSLGPVPTHVILEPEDDRLAPTTGLIKVAPLTREGVGVRQRAGDSTGLQNDVLHVWRYPAFLPASWTLALHQALPGSPYLVFGAALALCTFAWVAAMRELDVPIAIGFDAREAWR